MYSRKRFVNFICSFKRYKNTIDYSRIPVILEEDLEESFVRGSGPGGSKMSKTSNCVVLKHKPTGIVVKCHVSRLLQDNQKLARELLLAKVDNCINGEYSINSQKKQIEEKKISLNSHKRERVRRLKEKWKESNQIIDTIVK